MCGGLAMAVYGAPRARVDIDLLILAERLEEAKSLATTARLKLASQLRRLCLSLGKAKPVDRSAKQSALSESPHIGQQTRKSKG